MKRCHAPEERSPAWKQRAVVEKDVGSRPQIRGQKQRRIRGPGERHHPSLPSLPPPFCPTLSVPSQRTSRRSQPYLHFQQRFCALTEGTPPDSGQTSLSLVSRRGGGTGASRVLNHRPPHARHWTGPSLFTSHDNLDTSLHVLIRSVRH